LAVLAVLAPWGALPTLATDYQVRAFVEPRGRITDTQTLRLVVEVQGQEFGSVAVPKLPALRNLRIVGGPNSSQSSVINFDGTTSHVLMTRQLIYTLLPDGPGPAEIPSIDVQVGSEVRRTEPLRFEVERGPSGRPQAAPDGTPAPGGGGDDIPVFVGARLGAEEVWVGESVDADVTLYAATQVTGLDLFEEPSFSNFWVEDAKPDPNAEGYRTTIEGRPYNAFPIVRKVLVPATPGSYSLTPYGVRIQVSRSTGDVFRDFFSNAAARTVLRRTEPLRLKVKPLPETGRPDDFSGVVGSFALHVAADRHTARVNDAVALKATVEGTGFLRSGPAPTLEATPDLKVFEPKVTESSEIRDGKLNSRKTWEWVVVPLAPGEVRLPAVRYAVFDPTTATYEVLAGEPVVLTVERGEPLADDTVARGDVRLERRDIAFIKPLRGRLLDRQPRVHQRAWYVALLVLPAVMGPLIVVAGRRRALYRQNHSLARARRARTRARRRLRAARQRADRSGSDSFHEEVARALVDYIADRFDRAPAGLTYDVADELLASRGVSAELRGRLRTCLETCDFARYVRSSDDPQRAEQVYRESSAVVDELEEALS
jgi:hypothetical protein